MHGVFKYHPEIEAYDYHMWYESGTNEVGRYFIDRREFAPLCELPGKSFQLAMMYDKGYAYASSWYTAKTTVFCASNGERRDERVPGNGLNFHELDGDSIMIENKSGKCFIYDMPLRTIRRELGENRAFSVGGCTYAIIKDEDTSKEEVWRLDADFQNQGDPIVVTENILCHAGKQLYYHDKRALRRIDLDTGSRTELADDFVRKGSHSFSDGAYYFMNAKGLFRVGNGETTVKKLLDKKELYLEGEQDWFVYALGNRYFSVEYKALNSGRWVRIFDGDSGELIRELKPAIAEDPEDTKSVGCYADSYHEGIGFVTPADIYDFVTNTRTPLPLADDIQARRAARGPH